MKTEHCKTDQYFFLHFLKYCALIAMVINGNGMDDTCFGGFNYEEGSYRVNFYSYFLLIATSYCSVFNS